MRSQAPPATAAPPLPRSVTERLLAGSDAIARRLSRRLVEDIPLGPEYRTPAYLRLVLRASRDGLRALLRQLNDGRPVHPAELAGLGAAGARQAELDVPLEVLLSGYRLAAKVVWREVVDEAVRLGELSPPTVVALSEQVLEYLDQISGAVGSAYLETRERLVRQRDRERDHLLQRLLAGDATPELRRLAAATGLELLPPYRALALAAEGVDAEGRLRQAWRCARVLVAPDDPGTLVALVDPEASVAALHRSAVDVLGEALVVAEGPVAHHLAEIGPAARRARLALATGQRLDPARAVHHHADTAVYAAAAIDPGAVDAHVERLLGPLLLPRHADLLATLEAALEARGPAEAAARLGVHRHTVVYRLGRVAELTGLDVDDPATRHRVWLALRLLRLR